MKYNFKYYSLKIYFFSIITITLVAYIDFIAINDKGSSVFLGIVIISWIASYSIWKKLFKATNKKISFFYYVLNFLHIWLIWKLSY